MVTSWLRIKFESPAFRMFIDEIKKRRVQVESKLQDLILRCYSS